MVQFLKDHSHGFSVFENTAFTEMALHNVKLSRVKWKQTFPSSGRLQCDHNNTSWTQL